MIFSRLASTPAPSSGEDETLTRHKVFPGRRKQSGGPIDTSTAKTLGGPGRSAGHRSPCPIKAKKKKQTNNRNTSQFPCKKSRNFYMKSSPTNSGRKPRRSAS